MTAKIRGERHGGEMVLAILLFVVAALLGWTCVMLVDVVNRERPASGVVLQKRSAGIEI